MSDTPTLDTFVHAVADSVLLWNQSFEMLALGSEEAFAALYEQAGSNIGHLLLAGRSADLFARDASSLQALAATTIARVFYMIASSHQVLISATNLDDVNLGGLVTPKELEAELTKGGVIQYMDKNAA